ncbi:MAG: SGNH/GDSL hydrolase family protein [Planctomycetes bacterium]|nr:SGNH/GDSL hydrolase family protein [Planctomycetota bacterium]
MSIAKGFALGVALLFAPSDVQGAEQAPSDVGGRSALHNSFVALTTRQALTIAVIGNSVTAGGALVDGRSLSFWQVAADWFRARFPAADVRVERGIIFAIGPEVQVFRFEDKVLAVRPDLVIAEFAAANGAWGEAGRAVTEPAAEGWVRRLRFHLPDADCLLNFALFQTMMDDHRAGRVPPAVAFLQAVGAAYGCAVADSQAEIARRILAGDPWDRYMSDAIHPSPDGYAVHGEVVTATLEREWRSFAALPEDRRIVHHHALPTATLVAQPWQFVRFAPPWLASDLEGFRLARGGRHGAIEAGAGGASGVFDAGCGRIVGWYRHSPGIQALLEVSADGGPWTAMPLDHEPRFTEQDDPEHYLQRQFFAAYGLPQTIHRLAFRVAAGDLPAGAVARIAGFFVVERPVGEVAVP